MHEAIVRWEAFWFRLVPADVYALLRILFGALGVACILGLTPVDLHWPPGGIVPMPPGQEWREELIRLGVADLFGWSFFLLMLAAFACMTIGYRTGWAVTLAFALSLLQVLWNRLPLSGANSTMIVVLFCLTWAECGGRPSVDAWLAARRGAPIPTRSPIWPLRLLRLQVAIIYLSSGLWKFFGETWRDGSAIHYALQLNGYHRFPETLPASWDWVGTIGTYATLFWELGFIVMILHPLTRAVALAMGVAIHAGIWATLELGPFSFIMVCSYAAYLTPGTISPLLLRAARTPIEAPGEETPLRGVTATRPRV